MCEQTEISYLDGDIVWVKLGACWWPGQVTSFHNLPEDIQVEFQKKPLIAAVKFFQEDTYEFVKNLHQIYKYNCTQKDDFIKKGLDKHRTKSKDGTSYMDKFPGDVEMAEKLTGGDPDILMSEKFSPEEKPDISALFGEKKIPKRKRERDDMSRRSEGSGGMVVARKITHPRFLRESDHEIRIRQQPSSMPSTPKTPSADSPQFSCNLCNFTSTRVNVIICHRKSHCSSGGLESPLGRPRILSQPKSASRASASDTQKRKYVRKTKSLSSKGKTERESEPVKRKHTKQIEKSTTKKKKTDPELREKLLADWDDESDEDMDLDMNKSVDASSIESPSMKNSVKTVNDTDSTENKDTIVDDGNEIIKASEKLLRETDKFTSLLGVTDTDSSSRQSNNKHDDFFTETDTSTSTQVKEEKSPAYKKPKKLIASLEERKSTSSERNDNQSRFSCFDFDEEDIPEAPITPVRKIPRIFGEKNTSVKKEILKKFAMSQALKNDKINDTESEEKPPKDFFDNKEPRAKEKDQGDTEESPSPERETGSLDPVKEQRERDGKGVEETLDTIEKEGDKSPLANSGITELEIVEIFEVEGEKEEREDNEGSSKKSPKYEMQLDSVSSIDKKAQDHDDSVQTERTNDPNETVSELERTNRRDRKSRISQLDREHDESMSEIATTETEDETISELADSLRGNSENSDTDGNLNQANWDTSASEKVKRSLDGRGSTGKPVPRRRGRPRKSLPALGDPSGNGSDSAKHDVVNKQISTLASRNSERKTSESDSERSWSGRRRKPNKKYLHTEIYSSSPEHRVSKTDESQSETEDKSHSEKTGRARRGKKKSAVVETRTESVEKTKDEEEFEFSNRTLDTTDRSLATQVTGESKIHEEFGHTAHETKSSVIDDEGESSVSRIFDFDKKKESGVASPVNITKLLSSGDSEIAGSHKSLEEENYEKSCQSENRRDTTRDTKMSVDETKSGPRLDTTKTNVDKLPPKKSQIKKFELSQIDLLDACAEQVAAEQAAAEKLYEERRAAERMAAAEKLAAEKKAAEILEAEKLAAEKKLADKLAAEKLAAEKLAAEKLAAEELAAEKRLAEKLAAEKLAAEILAAETLAVEKIAAEKLEAERIAAEKLAVEKLAAEKEAAERLAAEKEAAEKLAAEKEAADKLAAEKEAADKLAAEKEAAEKLAAEKEAAEKLAREKEAMERAEAEKLAEEERKIAEDLMTNQRDRKIEETDEAAKINTAEVSSDETGKVIVETVPTMSDKDATLMTVSDNLLDTSVKDSTMETIEAVLARITSEEPTEETTMITEEKSNEESGTSETSVKVESTVPKENVRIPESVEDQRQSTMHNRYRGKSAAEMSSKLKKDRDNVDEEVPVNTFQEAFLKTLHIDKKDGETTTTTETSSQQAKEVAAPPSVENVQPEQTIVIAIASGNSETFLPVTSVQDSQIIQPLNAMTEFEGVEILVPENIVGVETKMDDASAATSQTDLAATLVGSDVKNEGTLSLDLQKIQDTLSDAISTPSPNSDTNVPVKKREKPRIIENVTLKEPMQILKSKLMEKLPSKSTKHKLDSETPKKGESKGAPRAKMMKIDSGNGKSRSPGKGGSFTITRKLQALKAEEAATAAAIEQDKAQSQIAQALTISAGGEKFIQQSSQGLADMELDINSMPFVLSEDVLTPESIENMPVVISSILPSSSAIVPTTLALSPTTQLVATNPEGSGVQLKSTSETVTTESTSTGKKKSGTPAILKNKGKGKPTITSIKTLVPPFAGGGVKGLKFQSQPATGKVMPMVQQKSSSTPGKYVIVQTAGGQQMRYSVQGKPGSQQKIAIPAGKATGSAQIVQQGGKVVILTSAQSGQTKMLPLNITKSMSGKVQKIVNNKGQIYTSISPQGIISSKTMIAPKTDAGSPTTSKIAQGQKIMSAQGIVTSKGVLTPISSGKSSLLSTLSQGILTKGGIYTPISSAQLAGKSMIGGKNLMNKGATILSSVSSQTMGTSKGPLLAPMSHTLTSKTILNTQGLVTPKGTVLTPITGQQVKAIAAKSPAKCGKVHYQSVQQKLQLPMLQKCQKLPVSSSSQIRAGGSVKSPGGGGTIVLQNTIVGSPKTPTTSGKKIVRQTAHQLGTIRSPQAAMTQTANSQSPQAQMLQRGKSLTAATTMQRVTTPRNTGRQSKTQKIVVQRNPESLLGAAGTSQIANIQGKSIMSANVAKTPTMSNKQRTGKSNRNSPKNISNVASPSSLAVGTTMSIETSTAITPTIQSTLPLAIGSTLPVPALVTSGTELPISETEGIAKMDDATMDNAALAKESYKQEIVKADNAASEVPKVEETKISPQPQIMALPTESSDGTQTYVLVTIDEQGQIQPLDNNTLMSLEGTTQNADGTRTLYIDPSSLGEAGTLDNIVLQFDNGVMPNIQSSVGETSQSIVTTESFATSEIIQTSNQDILAAALANTDFQQEIGLPESTQSSVMSTVLTQTSLINQTILQSTIIPPTEPISSPSVLETSLTLNQPIMTPLEVPSSMPIQVESAPPSVVSTIPTSLELPITITDSNISYISTASAAAAAAKAVAASATTVEPHVPIPGNSMPDIGEIMESTGADEIVTADNPVSTRYLVLPAIDENMTIESQHDVETGTDSTTASVTYSVSIPENIGIDNAQGQTTPSMPIIDDGYIETTEQRFAEVTVNDMLVSKSSTISTPEIATSEIMDTSTAHEAPEASVESKKSESHENDPSTFTQIESYTPHDVPVTEEMIVKEQEPIEAEKNETKESSNEKTMVDETSSETMQIDEQSTEVITTCTSMIDESCNVTSDMHEETEVPKDVASEPASLAVQGTSDTLEDVKSAECNEQGIDSMASTSVSANETSSFEQRPIDETNSSSDNRNDEVPSASVNLECESMIVEEAVEMEIYPSENPVTPDTANSLGVSSQAETIQEATMENVEMRTDSSTNETSQEEKPSQSFEKFDDTGVTSDSTERPTQSVGKSENSQEASQSVAYESMEIDENTVTGEPPTQSFEDSKLNEASQSYERTIEVNTNAPTQSFNEIMQCQEEEEDGTSDAIDDQSFPTQSYEVGKMEDLSGNLESDAVAIGQEGNIPSQSNDIGNDGIGTSSVSTNNSGLNEDETASSSYVPETPENQERDQDQESAISTSSYEIPPCEELNIASSSVIPDTSVRSEHMSIHDNGVPEIPTSSYNLNPDSSSSTSHVDALPTSSYEDQVIVEQNVSTSYEVPISMPVVEENSSQNFVTESTDHRNEPTSYYARHPEVTASYYDTVNQDSLSRLEADPQEEVTPSYYEQPQDITSEASQSYFRQTPRYSSQNVSPSYYDPTPETEASQSSYYSQDIEGNEQSSRNVEASQSFYQETTDEMRLRQQGEATPTYTERYPVDYALANSPIERHDLVESSVPATRPTER